MFCTATKAFKSLTDNEMIKLALNGEQRAYETLVARHWQSIRYKMFQRTNDSELANDLTIEVFARAFEKLAMYVNDYAFSTWLHAVATNHCNNRFRKKSTPIVSFAALNSNGFERDYLENIQCDNPNAVQLMMQSQKSEAIASSVARMEAKHRILIELRYVESLSYIEIATLLGIPLGTLKKRLFMAKQQLRLNQIKFLRNDQKAAF